MADVKISLYDKTGKVKLGELVNCIDCYVEEERNGLFELNLSYPISDNLHSQLEEENIIVANANDTLLSQKFRIYLTRKVMDGIIEVYARHISFDLAYDYVNDITFTNQSCEYALNSLFRQSQFSTHYRGYSDIINAQDYSMSMCNILEAIAGKKGSIIDTYGNGAEILRDNTNIHILNRRGNDNGVTIEYRKNLTGFDLEEDTTDLITRIIPYAKYNQGNEEVIVKAPPVDSKYINNYSHPYIRHIDYSDKFRNGEIPTPEKLTILAENDFRDNRKDIIKQNFKIQFIPLSRCVGYEGLEDRISLCDTVTVINTMYDIETQVKVIKYTYDVLTGRYKSIELGEPKTTLGDIIAGPGNNTVTEEEVRDIVNNAPSTNYPNTLPSVPVVTLRAGLGVIAISWTFEAKAYYTYEVYASRTKDFVPNAFDLIFKGQSSAFLHEVLPNQTWYYRVCAINSYGSRTTFSEQVSATTTKIADGTEYFDNAAIKDALIADLRADRAWVGKFQGEYIDARNLSVTDGNGKRTLDIDSFGNVNLDVATLKIKSTDVDKSLTEVMQTTEALSLKVQGMQDKIGQDLIKNGNFSAGYSEWLIPFDGPISPNNCRIIEHGAIKYISQLAGQMPSLTVAQLGIKVKDKMTYTFKIALAGDVNTDRIDCDLAISQNGKEWNKTNGSATWGTLDKPGVWQASYTSTADSTVDIKIVIWNRDGKNVYATDIILLEPGGDYAPAQQVAEIKVQADRIEQSVATLDKNTSTSITQLSNQIKSKVDENGVKSVIEQNPDSIKIGFNEINDTFSITPTEVYMKGIDGNKHLRFYDGKMRIVHPNGSDFGYIGRNKWNGTDVYGMVIDMDAHTSFSIGFDDGMHYLSSFACVKSPIQTSSGYLDKGVHVYEKFITHGAEFVGTQNITSINHPNGSGKGDISIWSSLDMHNWNIKNTTITKELVPKTKELKSIIVKNKLDYKTYMCESSHKDTIILKCDEVVSTVNNEIIVEIPQIFAENINDDYNIHIHKTTFGDYRIKEQNRYYFIVESDRDICFKWDILATKISTDYNILTLANESYMVKEPEQLVDCFVDNPRIKRK